MSKLFDESSDSEVEIKTDNDYAKKYDNWRQKEELNKCKQSNLFLPFFLTSVSVWFISVKTKYGEDPSTFLDESSESTTSSDDDEAKELTEGVERDFFKTLASLKSKDPKIYDPNVSFFNSDDEGNDETVKDKSKKARKKDRPLSIRDYERNFVLRKGIVDDDKEEISRFVCKCKYSSGDVFITYFKDPICRKNLQAKGLWEIGTILKTKMKIGCEKKNPKHRRKTLLKKTISKSGFWGKKNIFETKKSKMT